MTDQFAQWLEDQLQYEISEKEREMNLIDEDFFSDPDLVIQARLSSIATLVHVKQHYEQLKIERR